LSRTITKIICITAFLNSLEFIRNNTVIDSLLVISLIVSIRKDDVRFQLHCGWHFDVNEQNKQINIFVKYIEWKTVHLSNIYSTFFPFLLFCLIPFVARCRAPATHRPQSWIRSLYNTGLSVCTEERQF